MPNLLFILLQTPPAPDGWTLTDIGTALGIGVGVAGLALAWWPIFQQYRARRSLEAEFGADFYSREIIEDATRFYVRPNCSSIDPMQEAEMRYIVSTEEDLFSAVDKFLGKESSHRHLLLLADSGMGKSSFVLSYHAHNQSLRKSRRQRLAILPLGIPDPLLEISKIEDKKNVVIFLDAFDEDTKAIQDHHQRLVELMAACAPFKRVVLTCRTQFFEKDEEIPKQTGIAVVRPRKPGESGVYEFWKLYLSPLNDEQISKFIRKRYPTRTYLWKTRAKRREAHQLVNKIPLLSVRPLLLSYIPDVMESDVKVEFTFQLYEIMVEEWLKREDKWIDKSALRKFSEDLAVDLYVNRLKRSSERISRQEFKAMLEHQGIRADHWKYTARALLNRDARGNLKFAHRSIMEYLFVQQFFYGNDQCKGIEWTDLMIMFLGEIIHYHYKEHRRLPIGIEPTDLFSIPNFALEPIHHFRSAPAHLINLNSVVETLSRPYTSGNLLPLHIFNLESHGGDNTVIIDHASGLVWQQSGSHQPLPHEEALEYVAELNATTHCSYASWRLPTYEEIVYMFSQDEETGMVYLDKFFDRCQYRIWSCDTSGGHPLSSFVLDEILNLSSLMDAVLAFNKKIRDSNYVRAVCTLENKSLSRLGGGLSSGMRSEEF